VSSPDTGGPHRAGLSPERVRDAALKLIDRDGVDGFSMRKLAAELGVEAMSLYRHAPSRDAILDGVIDEVAAGVVLDPASPDWRAQVRLFAVGLREQLVTHPNVFRLVLVRPLTTPLPLRGPAVLRATEPLLDVLSRGGLTPVAAAAAYRRVIAFVMGRVLVELRPIAVDPDEPEPALRLGLHHLPALEYPHLREEVEHLTLFDGEAEFRAGLEALVASL
jgi:AcrR family transcriptional regulator